MNLLAEQNTQGIRAIVLQEGFQFVGFSKAEFLENEAHRLERWLNNHMHGTMHYMEHHFDKRLNPALLVPGAKSVVSLLYNYFPESPQKTSIPQLSKYAYGEDYHRVIKEKLKRVMERIEEEIGEVNGRVFVDSAPVLEKAWAAKSGLGWMGKNSNLIHPKAGSFFFLAELIIDMETTPDGPIKDYCGTCTRCIDACPTQAIVEPYVVDGSKCISHFTIELKDAIPDEMAGQWTDWMFGCDVCQDVCPWNRFSTPHAEEKFRPQDGALTITEKEWIEMTEETFENLFGKSALKRRGLAGIKHNVRHLQKQKSSDF